MPQMWHLRLILSLVLSLVASTPAHACTPGPGYEPATPEAKARAAGLVILGTALSNIAGGKVIEVSKWLKGQGPRYVLIYGFGSSAACLSDVALGHQAVFYGKLDRATGSISLNYTGIHDAIDDADRAARVTAVLKFAPSAPSSAAIRETR